MIASIGTAFGSSDTDTKYSTGSDPVREPGSDEDTNPFDVIEFITIPSGEVFTTRVKDSTSTLYIDPDNVPAESRDEFASVLQEAFVHEGGFSVKQAASIVSAVRNELIRQEAKTLSKFYKGKVEDEVYRLIQKSMIFRLVEKYSNLSKGEVEKRKVEIAGSMDTDAGIALSSICSAGYLDERRLFRHMYKDMVKNGDKTNQDYKFAFRELALQRAFVVFVKDDPDSNSIAMDIYHEAFSKCLKIDNYRYNVGFVDLCGRNDKNRDLIQQVEQIFDDNHPGFKCSRFSPKNSDQLIVRIEPDSL